MWGRGGVRAWGRLNRQDGGRFNRRGRRGRGDEGSGEWRVERREKREERRENGERPQRRGDAENDAEMTREARVVTLLKA